MPQDHLPPPRARLTPEQLSLRFQPLALLTPDEIYERCDEALLGQLKEDRRIERKPAGTHAPVLGDYLAMFANTSPDGGVVVVGMEDDGEVSGCAGATPDHMNELERCGETYCPQARYETKRIPARRSDGQPDYLTLFRVQYCEDRVVETNRRESFVRRADTKHRLNPHEKR